jgi:hypothetical protein
MIKKRLKEKRDKRREKTKKKNFFIFCRLFLY